MQLCLLPQAAGRLPFPGRRVHEGTDAQREVRVKQGQPRPKRPCPIVVVCRCEEVTAAGIRAAVRQGYHSLEELKRVLRVGMGHCQGRGCLRIIARIVQEETGIPGSSQKLPRPRPPLKPMPLRLLAESASDEPRAVRSGRN
ncbi:hypothetical protein FJY69_03515 [candidate division WOR-3 bacterium]|nr:hypothetical protein [candidate division WOR-3 bacterium]